MSEEGTMEYEAGVALASAKFAMWLAEYVTAKEEETDQVLVTESPAVGILALLATSLMALEVFAQKGNEAAQHDVVEALGLAVNMFGSIGGAMVSGDDQPYERALEFIDVARGFGLTLAFDFGEDVMMPEQDQAPELVVQEKDDLTDDAEVVDDSDTA